VRAGGNNRRRPSAGELEDVFDDPAHGEPGRDKLAVHWAWEALLLIALGAVAFLWRKADPSAFKGAALKDLMVFAAAVGLLAMASGLALRAAVPNLAVGPLAMAGAVFFAGHSSRGMVATVGIVMLLTAAAGIAIAAVVTLFHVPGWAASFAVSLAAIAWIQKSPQVVKVQSTYDPKKDAVLWFGMVAVLAAGGAIAGTMKPIRRALGRFRPVSDPAYRRGASAAGLAAAAIIVSSALAGLAGTLVAMRSDEIGTADGGLTASGLTLTGLGLGVALLGGTSAYGRRGGVFGTILATLLMVMFVGYSEDKNWKISILVIAGVAIGIGLLVTRLVEAFGRPHGDDDDLDSRGGWTRVIPSQASSSNGWNPMVSTAARADDDAWGTTASWESR
jgi:hypothetical protein